MPFSLAALVLAWRGLEPSTPRRGTYLDIVGLALLSPGIAARKSIRYSIAGVDVAAVHAGPGLLPALLN